jgi:glycine/D-amino acid oxidase-like deaminating enzyme
MPSNSMWLTGRNQKYKSLYGEEKTDVAVIGGGIAGLTAAYLLSMSGVGVTVLEAGTVAGGASGHTAAHVTSQHGLAYAGLTRRWGEERARLIADANEKAIHLAAGIVEAENIACDFTAQDSYVFTEEVEKEGDIEEETEAASKLGIMADITNTDPFIFPYHVAVRFRNQAMMHPVNYVAGLAAAVVRNGGHIHELSRVLEYKEGVSKTADGSLKAKCTIIATHFPIVNVPGWYHLRMYRMRSWAVALENAPIPTGMWLSADRGGYGYRRQGSSLIVCGGDSRSGSEKETDHYDTLRKHALGRFPESKASNFWSGQYACTVDGLPYIGRYSDRTPSLFVAAGFGKWGMTQGTISGHIICDLVLDRKNPTADLYSPQRGLAPAAWGKTASVNLSTAWYLTSSAFKPQRPICSHYGCRMVWNKDEHTWDCPCHGSRFSEDGIVIDSPAVKNIQPQKGP